MSRTSASRRLSALVAMPTIALMGCSEPEATLLAIEADEPDRRFAIEASLEPDAPRSRLSIRVAPRAGWRLEPDAPARLELTPGPGLVFEPATQAGDDAAELDEQGLVFTSLVTAGPGASREATAALRFGICEGPDRSCAIVRRTLALRLPER